jgi:hypothetical protein
VTASLSIEVTELPLEQITADLVAVGVFSDEKPLRGGVGRIDWRLCGFPSELLVAGRYSAKRGEALLVPTFGRLTSPRALFLGLGRRRYHGPGRVEAATADALRRGLALGARRLALAPPGAASDDYARFGEAVILGAVDALRETGGSIELCLPVGDDDKGRFTQALEEASRGELNPTIRFLRPPPAPTPPHFSLGGPPVL